MSNNFDTRRICQRTMITSKNAREEITMTSYPVVNKTSLSRKPCARVRHEKSPEAPLGGGLTMTSYPVSNNTSLSRKTCIQIKSYFGTLSGSHGRSSRIRRVKSPEASLGGKLRWRHIRLAIKPRYLGNPASRITNYYGALSESHGRSFGTRH